MASPFPDQDPHSKSWAFADHFPQSVLKRAPGSLACVPLGGDDQGAVVGEQGVEEGLPVLSGVSTQPGVGHEGGRPQILWFPVTIKVYLSR